MDSIRRLPKLGSCLVVAGNSLFVVHGGISDEGRCVTCSHFIRPPRNLAAYRPPGWRDRKLDKLGPKAPM